MWNKNAGRLLCWTTVMRRTAPTTRTSCLNPRMETVRFSSLFLFDGPVVLLYVLSCCAVCISLLATTKNFRSATKYHRTQQSLQWSFNNRAYS